MTKVASVDWLSQAFLADPYSHYKALRESDPVHWDETRGSWLLTRYRDVAATLRDDDNLSAEQGPAFSMLVTDPPDHTRLRSLVSKAFTARTVRRLSGRIREIIDELLDAVVGRGEMEVIADFAYPLPITVIAELIGVEPERQDFFRQASQKIAVALGPITDPAVAMRAFEGRTELLQYFDELIAKRRTNPREDLISALLAAEDRGDFLSHQELLGMLLLRRDPCPHLAFGSGIHFCLGAQLARLEGQIAISAAVRRFPALRLAGDDLRWRPAPVLRGLEALPVTF